MNTCYSNNFKHGSFGFISFQPRQEIFFTARRVTIMNPYIQIAIHQQVRAMEQMMLVNYLATFLLLNELAKNLQRENLSQEPATRFSWKNPTFSSNSNQYKSEEQPKPASYAKTYQQSAPKPTHTRQEQPKPTSHKETSRSSAAQNRKPILATSTLTVEDANLCQNNKNEFLRKIEIQNPEKVPFTKVNSIFKKQCLRWHPDKNNGRDEKFKIANQYRDEYNEKMKPHAQTNNNGSNIVLDDKILAELDSYFKL